jgi:hypothetical protein
MPSLETAARSLKLVSIIAPVHNDAEIEAAITALGREPGAAAIIAQTVASGFTISCRDVPKIA